MLQIVKDFDLRTFYHKSRNTPAFRHGDNGFSKWVNAACERELQRLEAGGDDEPGDYLQ